MGHTLGGSLLSTSFLFLREGKRRRVRTTKKKKKPSGEEEKENLEKVMWAGWACGVRVACEQGRDYDEIR
jgi:hypothetical protein